MRVDVAIYHFSVKIISRADGRSAVAAAAYRAATALADDRLGRIHDFSGKDDLVHSEMLLPAGAPARWSDRATLWNEVEAFERRKDAQLARELEFALPRELSTDDGIALAREFVAAQFVARGMVADLNVHSPVGDDGLAKPHAHVMLTLRGVEGDGFGPKVRDWNAAPELLRWREAWADAANTRLAELGHDVRIDHRNFEAQGIDLEPQGKIGPAGQRRDERGEAAERAAEHRAIARRNGERIAEEPELALRTLSHGQATFTRQDLARFLHRHSDGAEQFAKLLASVDASPELVCIGSDRKGTERYSTREMIAIEARLAKSADELANRCEHRVSRRSADAAPRGTSLSAEQRAAFEHVVGGSDLAVVVGFAGSGKSLMLGVAREAWERDGYSVRGAALSGIAAEGLEGSSGIASRTLASLEHAWAKGYEELTSRDVLVIDEAGLVGSRQLERVVSHARDAGAKVVLVGDAEQLQAIEAGAAFRALAERHGAAEITAVQRQRIDWQREATVELATARTGAALARYGESGAVHAHETHEDARVALVERWAKAAAEKGGSSVILAYTRDDVRALNELARDRMRATGKLGDEIEVMTERGERRFAAGDRVMFLANERSLGVKNGTLGRVVAVREHGMTVVLDGTDARQLTFEFKDYAQIDHGYAATIHKAQGVTVDRAFVLGSEHMDRHAAYVALSRHRDRVELHYGRDAFADERQLVRRLSRERTKDSTLDYELAGRDGSAMQAGAHASRSGGRFEGLRLDDGAGSDATAGVQRPSATRTRSPTPLDHAAERFADSWAVAERMRSRDLPVLPHQARTLDAAGQALDRLRPGMAARLDAALARSPELADRKDSDGPRGATLVAAAARQPMADKGFERSRERDLGMER